MDSPESDSTIENEKAYHLVTVGFDGEAKAASYLTKADVLSRARAAAASGMVNNLFLFRGDRINTTRPPLRAVFSHDEVVSLGPPLPPAVEIDEDGRVDSDSLGPPTASANPPADSTKKSKGVSPWGGLDD